MKEDFNNKHYLGYLYDGNGYHNGAVDLYGVDEVAKFVCDNINNDKMITDLLDNHIVNTFGFFIDRYGQFVSNEERNLLHTAIISLQEKLGLSF